MKLIQNKQRKEPLKGALENSCSEICGQNSSKMSIKVYSLSKVEGLESATLLKLKFFIGIFQGFSCEFYLAPFRTAIKNPFFREHLHWLPLKHGQHSNMTAVSWKHVQKHEGSSFDSHFDRVRVWLLVHSNINSMKFPVCRAK